MAKTFVPGRSFGVPARAAAPPHRHAFVADVDAWCVTISPGDCGGTEWEPFDVTVRKRVDFLCRIPGLFDATLVELEALARHAEERRYEPGLALVNQGQECRGAYFILSGTAAIIRRIRIDNRKTTGRQPEEERINREPDAPVPDHLRSALPDAAKANDRRRVVRARVGAAMLTRDGDRGDGSGDSPGGDSDVVDVQLRVVGSLGVVGGGDYFDRPAPCACFAVARGAKPVAALFIACKHLAKIFSPKAMERFRRGCHPAPADDALRKSLAAKEASEAANRAAWTGPDGTAIEGVEPVDPHEELRRNPLAYSDSDSDTRATSTSAAPIDPRWSLARDDRSGFIFDKGARGIPTRGRRRRKTAVSSSDGRFTATCTTRARTRTGSGPRSAGVSARAPIIRRGAFNVEQRRPTRTRRSWPRFATWASSPPSRRSSRGPRTRRRGKGRTTASFWTTSRRSTLG